jgi:hypothetical protein
LKRALQAGGDHEILRALVLVGMHLLLDVDEFEEIARVTTY